MHVYLNLTAEQADALLADRVPDPGEAIVLRCQNSGSFCVYLDEGYAALRRTVRRNIGSNARYTLAVCDRRAAGDALRSAFCLDDAGGVVLPTQTADVTLKEEA